MNQIVVCRPTNNGPIDDAALEYVLDAEGSVRIFENIEQAKQELRDDGYRNEDLRRMTFLSSCGVCRRCGSPLFKSLISGYKYQCFSCDEDFCGFEQEGVIEMREVRTMYPPTGKRTHQFCLVERSGKEMWVDLTILRKSRSFDSVPVFRLEGEALIYDHFERCSRLHEKGLY